MILAGRVRVNGEVVSELGVRVLPGVDAVELDGEAVSTPAARWIAFHKPPGVLTTRSDPHGGTTIYDLLPPDASGLHYVGRLDRDAEGLLLLTNEGDVAHRLQHPSGEVEREYWVEVAGTVKRAALDRLRSGVDLEDGPARAKAVSLLQAGAVRSQLTLVITEGRKREVRRMLSSVGHPVMKLRRTRFGAVELGGLDAGELRALSQGELEALHRLAGGDRTR